MFGAILASMILAIPLSVWFYFWFPNFLVKKRGFDYEVWHNAEERKKNYRFVKPRSNHFLMVVRGSKRIRYLFGDMFVAQRKIPRRPDEDYVLSNDFEDIVPLAIPRDFNWKGTEWSYPAEIGAELDIFVGLLEAWVFRVTGYRVIGATLTDLFNARLMSYNIARKDSMRKTTPTGEEGKNEDVSFYVDLRDQVVPYEIVDADTGGIEKIKRADGTLQEFQSAARIKRATGQVTVVIANPVDVMFGIDRPFENIDQVVIAAVVEAVREGTTRLARDRDWVRYVMDTAPVLANGRIPDLYPPEVYDKELIINPELMDGTTGTDEKKRWVANNKRRWTASKEVSGSLEKTGFYITSSRNDKLDFDEKSQTAIDNVQNAALDSQAAGYEREAHFQRAEGEAAYTRRELESVAEGAEKLKVHLENPGLVAEVLVAEQHSAAAKNAEKGAQVWLGGSGKPSPSVIVP